MIYGLANSKGGVGKTTIAVHLAWHLQKSGKTVLFIDADPQHSASVWIKEGLNDALLIEATDPEDILALTKKHQYEVDDIVIDGPAGLSATTRAIMLVADKVFLPCGPSILDLRAAGKAVALLREAQSVRDGQPKGFLVPNKLQKRTRLTHEMLNAVNALGIPVLRGLGLRQSFADSAGQALVVSEMASSNAATAMEEINQLTKEMTQ